jgi:hypothetical protein
MMILGRDITMTFIATPGQEEKYKKEKKKTQKQKNEE